jgi:lipopolysaccharide transport system permease protein
MRRGISNSKEENAGKWDIVIEPRSRLLQLNLKEVWRYKDLMLSFVRRDFVAQFKQTILGPVWHIIQPVLTTLMFLLIFSRIARISTDGIKPTLFYMSGITIWNYFSTCLTSTANTFVSNANIFGKVYFPRLVLPLSVVISNIIRFGIQFLLLLAMIIYYHFNGYPIHFTAYWLVIPFLLVLMAGIGLGLGIIISSLTTKYRDFAVLLTFIVQLGMYVTPIVYPLSYIESSKYRNIIQLNPVSPVVETFRYALFGKGTFDLMSIGYSVLFMIIVLFVGILFFNKVEKSFMDTV